MRPNRSSALAPLAALLLPCMGGCFSRTAILDEVSSDRQKAYEAWAAEHEGDRKNQAYIEGNLGLADAVKLGLRYNKGLQGVLAGKDEASGRVIESYSAALPHITAEGSFARLERAGGLAAAFRDNYSADLKVVQPIFRGGAIPSALRAARLYEALADENVRAAVQGVIFQTTAAYYDALLAKHLYRVNLDAVKSAEAHLSDARKRREMGEATHFDVLRAEVEVSNFKTAMIQQRNRIAVAKAKLLRLMGVSQQSEVALCDELEYLPMQPVLREAVRIALGNRPDLYRAELSVRLQREALRVAKSEYWPRIAGAFTQSHGKPDPNNPLENEWGNRWTLGLQATWNIFDGLGREGRIRQERAALRRQESALRDAEESALFEIRRAILDVRDAEEQVESQRLNVERSKEALRLAEVGYREGVNTEVDVTDARAARTRALGLYFQAVFAHSMARLGLQNAMGVLSPPPGDGEVPPASPVPPARIEEFEKSEAVPAPGVPEAD